MTIATDAARELEEQRRWCLQPRFAGLKTFDQFLHGEFLSEDEQRHRQSRAVSRIVDFAVAEVPYYRDLFAARGLRAGDIRGSGDLVKLPLLDKESVRANPDRLRPARLPRGEQIHGLFASSGSTGQPTKILHTVSSNAMFTFLAQRQCRWCRFDPKAMIVNIRTVTRRASEQPGASATGLNLDDETRPKTRWNYVGQFFETGPALVFNIMNSVERQLELLRANRPAYLCTRASLLEHLGYAAAGDAVVDSLESVLGNSEDLRAPTRRFVERVFGIPVHQDYGVNEVGLIAMRCAAGRYHVHAEHCYVEIVDGQGRPCPPGVTGRIVVTALRNPAMPLIRYDTDDMAEVLDGPCPCGRTLPSFGNLIGRYRRYVCLPEGAFKLFRVLRSAVNGLPGEVTHDLRQFQVHQYRDGRFELRVLVAGPLPPAFYEGVRAAWDAAIGDRPETLVVVEVGEILRGAGNKFQDFTSDYMPAPDNGPSDTKQA